MNEIFCFCCDLQIPALQSYLRRQAMLQQQGVHITSSAILTSTVHVGQGNHTSNSSQTIRDMGGLNNNRAGSPDNQIGRVPGVPRTAGEIVSPRTPGASSNAVDNSITVHEDPLHEGSSFDVNTPSDLDFISPALRRWSNSAGQDIDSRFWRRRLDLDRLRRAREQDAMLRDVGMDAGFGTEVSAEPATSSPLMHNSSFSAYSSVLPWILGGSSLFLPVFPEVSDGRGQSRNGDEAVVPDLNTNSTTPESGVTQVTEEGLRYRNVANSVGDT